MKYKLIKSDIEGLYRIKALYSFSDVRKGDIGGYVKSEYNLSHNGNCWIYNDAQVIERATIEDNVRVCNNAVVKGFSLIHDSVEILENALISGYSSIYDHAVISGNSKVKDVVLTGIVSIQGNAEIDGNKDMLIIQGFIYGSAVLTAYKSAGNKISIEFLDRLYNLEEFIEKFVKNYGEKYKQEINLVAELIKLKLT